jgi:hypothetical protein
MYTNTRPPLITSTLGVTPWPNLDTVKPWIVYVVLEDSSGTHNQGDVLPLTGVDPNTMEHISGTPKWMHRLGAFATLPDSNLEMVYYITEGENGRVVDEGRVSIGSTAGSLTGDGVAKADISCLKQVKIPSSLGEIKNVPIKISPKDVNGNVLTVDNVTLTSVRVGTGSAELTNEPMTLVNGVYTYNWELTYSSPADMYEMEFKVHVDSSGTNFRRFFYLAQTFKSTEYDPQRVKSGLVT